jgi:hypothetical protein
VAAKKGPGSKASLPQVRQKTTDVDLEWLGKVLEEEKTSKGAEKGKGPPPLPSVSSQPTIPRHDTIEVDSKWLIPPVAKKWRRKTSPEPREPLPLPSSIAVKPRGKLPPPLPREDEDETTDAAAPKTLKSGVRSSRRPPSTRK